ncbi:MAG: Fe-S cluster assembly protein NifU [Nitrospinota bacterium]|nr:Fe-S cluster assembly protein NifU [Nitrospinota bacterium]
MWDYTGKVKDHFLNPRNVGIIEDPDGVGEVGSMACGDALKLSFKLDEKKERIADIKFQTFGCASAIASSSALTEIVTGMTLDAAKKVTNKDIAEYLGGLPAQKMHCSVMGREALEAAIDNYEGVGESTKHELEGEVVCECFGVTEKEIRDTIRDNHLTTVEEVTNYTKAGGSCGKCIPKIETILGISPEESQVAATKPMTNLQRIQKITETIDNKIRPAMQGDGGDIELIDVVGEEVTVRLKGACSGCPASQVTLTDFVQKELRRAVEPDIVVKEIK